MSSPSSIEQARQQVTVFSIIQYVSLVPILVIAVLSQIPDFLTLSPELKKILPWVLAGVALLDFAIFRFILNKAKQQLQALENAQK